MPDALSWLGGIPLIAVIAYLAIRFGVGEGIVVEQTVGVITMLLIITLFMLKKFEIRLLGLFGLFRTRYI